MLREHLSEGRRHREGAVPSARLWRAEHSDALGTTSDLLGDGALSAEEIETADAQPGHFAPSEAENEADVEHRPVHPKFVSKGEDLLIGERVRFDGRRRREVDTAAGRTRDEIEIDRIREDC